MKNYNFNTLDKQLNRETKLVAKAKLKNENPSVLTAKKQNKNTPSKTVSNSKDYLFQTQLEKEAQSKQPVKKIQSSTPSSQEINQSYIDFLAIQEANKALRQSEMKRRK